MRFIRDFLHCNRHYALVSSCIHVQIVELCGSGHRQYSRIWLQIKADPKVIGLFGFRYLIPSHKVRICSAQISFCGRFYVIVNLCRPWWVAVAKISTSGRDWGCCQFVLQLPGPPAVPGGPRCRDKRCNVDHPSQHLWSSIMFAIILPHQTKQQTSLSAKESIGLQSSNGHLRWWSKMFEKYPLLKYFWNQ